MGKRKMAKHFALTITDDTFSFARKADAIAEEARFDGLYVLRTSLPVEPVDTAGTVRAYKSLAQVERAFRCLKTVDLELRPVFHWTATRVRAHVLLCMLAYYLEWHMRQPPRLRRDKLGTDAVRRS
jgi:transposase